MPEPFSGCWLWIGAYTSQGYGYLWSARRSKGKQVKRKICEAHRIAWKLYRGKIPAGLHVLHRCDTRVCVNPAHLFLGTNLINIHDAMAKGRSKPPPILRGEQNGSAKLTETQVREILQAHESQRKTAKLFGVSRTSIRNIRSRKKWRHVERGGGSY